jgi:three-Cys-motif partner protein
MLRDEDPAKWLYSDHTRAKHALLSRYIKAWLSILGRSGRRALGRGELVIVDAFAGKGRYLGGEPGSPLIFREIAGQVAADDRVDDVELFFIEPNLANYQDLVAALAERGPPARVTEQPVARTQFERAAVRILELLRGRPSFWFIDPFGFSGLPLALLRQILRQPRSELFITFMSRDMNRFLDVEQHRQASMQTLGLSDEAFERALDAVKASKKREFALRDLYLRRLQEGAGAKFVWPARIVSRGADETIYYLVHASNHIKAFREMKDATYELWGDRYAFLGREDYEIRSQLELPLFETGQAALKRVLAQVFAGRELSYQQLTDEAYPDPRFRMFIDRHFREALVGMIAEGGVRKQAVSTKRPLAVSGDDRLIFPARPNDHTA